MAGILMPPTSALIWNFDLLSQSRKYFGDFEELFIFKELLYVSQIELTLIKPNEQIEFKGTTNVGHSVRQINSRTNIEMVIQCVLLNSYLFGDGNNAG